MKGPQPSDLSYKREIFVLSTKFYHHAVSGMPGGGLGEHQRPAPSSSYIMQNDLFIQKAKGNHGQKYRFSHRPLSITNRSLCLTEKFVKSQFSGGGNLNNFS